MGWQAHSKREHPSGGSAEPEKKCPLSPLKMPPRKKFAFLTSADHNFSVYLTKLRPREEVSVKKWGCCEDPNEIRRAHQAEGSALSTATVNATYYPGSGGSNCSSRLDSKSDDIISKSRPKCISQSCAVQSWSHWQAELETWLVQTEACCRCKIHAGFRKLHANKTRGAFLCRTDDMLK